MKTVAIVIILIGLGLSLVTAVNFFTTEKVVDIGEVQITREKPNYFSWSPAVGFVVMGIGGIMLWRASSKKN